MENKGTKYQQIIDWVKMNIENGTLKYGDKLMSENELAEKFSTSRQTVRRATGDLVAQKLLTRVQGSGSYIGGQYRPARSEHYRSIAVVSTFYESYIFPPTLKGIERALSGAGYSMQVSFTDNRIQREREILEGLIEKDNIDGLILEPVKSVLPNPNLKYYEILKERGIPILCFNAFYPGLDVPCVRLDDQEAGRRMTEVLLNAGHRRIGGIFKSDDGQGPLRYAGYLDAMLNAGYKTSQNRMIWIDTPMTLHLSEIENYVLKRLEDCTAVLCYNDQVAAQVIDIAERHGRSVPEELSVVGIDDSYIAATGRIPISSLPHPKETLGRKVGENMVHMIENPEFDGGYLYQEEPVLRSSVKQIEREA
ncbi:MAG: GntR family transcriptional regulator [Eubacteriales bacterium]|nr:GntR family transcriptional regulator [Eubacteriales bacterium]